MDKESVLRSLDQLQKLSEEIGRSQKFGQPLPADTTKKWDQQLRFHVENIRKELDAVPADTAETEPRDLR